MSDGEYLPSTRLSLSGTVRTRISNSGEIVCYECGQTDQAAEIERLRAERNEQRARADRLGWEKARLIEWSSQDTRTMQDLLDAAWKRREER